MGRAGKRELLTVGPVESKAFVLFVLFSACHLLMSHGDLEPSSKAAVVFNHYLPHSPFFLSVNELYTFPLGTPRHGYGK